MNIDTSTLDLSTPGTYEVSYHCKLGDNEGSVRLIVVVTEQ